MALYIMGWSLEYPYRDDFRKKLGRRRKSIRKAYVSNPVLMSSKLNKLSHEAKQVRLYIKKFEEQPVKKSINTYKDYLTIEDIYNDLQNDLQWKLKKSIELLSEATGSTGYVQDTIEPLSEPASIVMQPRGRKFKDV